MALPDSFPANTRSVPARHAFDEQTLQALQAWWETNIRPCKSLTVRQFRGGQSNPTFWIHDGTEAAVLRKKPSGKLLKSAHAVEREARICRALKDTSVPVARVLGECEEDNVLDTPFFVMEFAAGRVFWNVQLPDEDPASRAAIYAELARVLATLHAVDYNDVGLAEYGKVGSYVARQVSRWSRQYQASRTHDVPAMDRLIALLPTCIPASERTTLVHGDYRLDNLIFHPTEPRAIALIDWELSTLGHPLADLAYTCMLYEVELPNIGGLLNADFVTSGIPTEDAFIAAYRSAGGKVDASDFRYFKAFGLFRLAAIAQGVYHRSQQGNASSENAAMFKDAVGLLASVAIRLLES